MSNSPYLRQPTSVRRVMIKVLAALIPGIAAYVWLFGAGILLQITLASITALAAEATMLRWRSKPVGIFITDGSALVTAWLIALTFPPIVPWWLTVLAVLIAIVVAKHLYGGLGQNPFNPAMVAFCVAIVAYPQLMSQWPTVGFTDFTAQVQAIFGPRQLDGIVMATPLDTLRTALHCPEARATVSSILGDRASFGAIGGKGWEWIALAYLLGGLWLVQQRIITWHIPFAFLAALTVVALSTHWLSPDRYAGPLFHAFTGGAMLGAFFIATDPVSAATTPRGKLIYAAGLGALTWIIRVFGAYPDGIAFATLLMNIGVPLIDKFTQPPVFGHKQRESDQRGDHP